MHQSKGYIFDLDGTLLDSMQMWLDIDKQFLLSKGIIPTEDYSQAVKEMGYKQGAQYTVDRYQLSLSPEQVIAEWQGMADYAYAKHIKLKHGARDVLDYLRINGAKLAIATALTMTSVKSALYNIGIYEFFDNITMLHEVDRSKEHPDIYLLAAKRLKLMPEECMVFEDLLPGIRAAKSAGFKVCGVFDCASKHQWEEIHKTSDVAIKSWHELLSSNLIF